MKIYYRRTRLRWTFLFALFWLLLGIISTTNNSDNYFNYLYLLLGAYFMWNYYFKSKYQYLTIENGTITMHGLFPVKVDTNDLKEVKIYSDVYILRTDNMELRIITKLIDKHSLKELKAGLKSLNV